MHRFFFCLCLFSTLSIQGQVVISRSFEGLERTKLSVVERLVQQEIGTQASYDTLESDLRRLKNFIGIYAADYRLDTLQEGIHLTYQVRENISRYPLAMLGGLQDNFWWELGFIDQNWQGRGEQLGLFMRQIDGRLGGKTYYTKPSIANSKWGAGLQLERYASQEPLYFSEETVDYRYENHNVGLFLFHYLRPEENIQFGFTYFQEDYAKVNLEQLSGPDAQRELKQLFRSAYQLNQVNPDQMQPTGYFFQISGEIVLQKTANEPFFLLRSSLKKYWPSGEKGLFASRLNFGYSTNKNTPFAPFVVDSRINIRGAGNRVDRGTASFVLNLEYRQILWQKKSWSIQGVAFTDIGSWRNPGGTINDLITFEHTKYFAGGGLRLVSSAASQLVLRIDYGYGLQPFGRQGIVLGLGQFF